MAQSRSYHPEDPGLPAIAVHELIAAHADILRRLRHAYGAEAQVFERDIGSVVERYAQYVHLLPATSDRHFRYAGGLFRLGLEIGFYALQAADGAIFAGGKTITARSALEPRWRYATFLAGLCSELYRGLGHLTVNNDHGAVWPACLRPLGPWLADTKSRHYQVLWPPDREDTRALNVVAMAHIVTPPITQYLAEANRVVIPHFIASVSGSVRAGDANTLDQLVRRSAALVMERNRHSAIVVPTLTCDASSLPPQHAACAAEPVPGDPTAAGKNIGQRPLPRAEQPAAQAPDSSAAARTMPMPDRLHPAVRAALRQIVSRLEAPPLAEAADGVEPGVFVPLREFERRSVDPSLAVRALSDAGMLVRDPCAAQSRTCVRVIAGERLLGVLLAPRSASRQQQSAIG